jgi:hypothetical protein
MRRRCSVDQPTGRRDPRRALIAGARRHLARALAVAVVFAPLLALFGTAGPAAAANTSGYYTNPTSPDNPTCPSGTYTVPAGTRYVQITAAGGAGAAGSTRVLFDGLNPGQGGTGARVTGILPVTPGQTLYVVVGRNGAFNYEDVATTYSGWPDGGQNATNNGGGGGSSFVTTQPLFARSGCQDGTKDTIVDPPTVMNLDRGRMLLVAGGGGGGGNAGSVRSGGNGGNAGARADFGGQAGSDGNHGDISNCYGHGGGGGTSTGPGGGGAECDGYNGQAGHGFYGGGGLIYGITPTLRVGAGGAGGGGWYGGGASSNANAFQGGGGGGAGSSYVRPTNYPASISQDTSGTPSVTITPVAAPTTTATLSGTTSGNNWFTSAMTVTLTARAGTFGLGKTYYTLDDPGCSAANFHALERCTEYKGPFTFVGGVHTLTYFSIDAEGLDEAAQATSFAVTPTTTAGVTVASLGTGTNPTATAGGAAGTAGSVSVTSTGSGVVGAAVYGANPAGATVFNSSDAFVDVIAPGSGLTGLTITDCHLNGGTTVSWWDGTAWVLASNQTYDATTGCVTALVTATSSPNLGQMAGTVFAAGSPPTTTAVATTADGQPYAAGTWTNQSVTVAFTCTAGATPSAPVTRGSDDQNQSVSGTCTDGVGQATTTTFGGINVDKTPPSCAIVVSPTVLWSPNGKPVAITGTVTAGDKLSGLARVLGGAVTSNEALALGDVRGFTINTTYPSPLQLGDVVNVAGTLVATRAGNGSGRIYSQLVTVMDQAGNTAPCTWTVTVPHDRR